MNEPPEIHGPFQFSSMLEKDLDKEKNITVYSEEELRNILLPEEILQTKTVNLTKEAELHKEGQKIEDHDSEIHQVDL